MTTVLYVDDEPGMRTVVRRQMERRGHTVHTAESIAEAKMRLDQDTIHGAFIDLWLGDGTGFDLFAWIQENHPAVSARVVFVTGDIAENTEARRSLTALGRPVFGKPLDFVAMERQVSAWDDR
jgi:DNA-binding NtrC family response regulator